MNQWEYDKYMPLIEDRIIVEYYVEERGRLAIINATAHIEQEYAVQDIADQIEQAPNIFYAAFVKTGSKSAFLDLSEEVDLVVKDRFDELVLEGEHARLLTLAHGPEARG